MSTSVTRYKAWLSLASQVSPALICIDKDTRRVKLQLSLSKSRYQIPCSMVVGV